MDFRWILLAVTVVLFGRTTIYYRNLKVHRRMPLLLGWFLVATFIWIAENIATYTRIWIYPNQTNQWEMVSLSKLNSWFLLMLLSFVLVSLINDIKKYSSEGRGEV